MYVAAHNYYIIKYMCRGTNTFFMFKVMRKNIFGYYIPMTATDKEEGKLLPTSILQCYDCKVKAAFKAQRVLEELKASVKEIFDFWNSGNIRIKSNRSIWKSIKEKIEELEGTE